MKTSLFAKMSSLAVVSAFSAAAVADTLLLADHNARMGPKQDARIECVQAAHNSPTLNVGQLFSERVAVQKGATPGSRVYVLSGTAWDNGARVPITARCVIGNAAGPIASVTRVHPPKTIATRGR